MIRSIVDFTIPKSSCHIYYKNFQGAIFSKSFFNNSEEGFYINGYVSKYFNNVFKKINLE
jgi:hypothetical protein